MGENKFGLIKNLALSTAAYFIYKTRKNAA